MLILAATPIGNLGDASPRLREALATAPVIAAEDTRVAQRLLAALGIAARPRLIALHDHNEKTRAAELAELAAAGEVLLLSDAGMPAVSDPGYAVVAAAVAAGVEVRVIPGPSAVLAALAVSGLPTDRFVFEGFPPRKPGERARALAALAAERRTLVFFEAPSRLAETLGAMAAAFGAERRAAVARELTKLYEQVHRGSLGELAEWAAGGVRGELVIVVEGAPEPVADADDALGSVLERVGAGQRLAEAAAAVAAETGLPRRELYQAALQARRDG